RALHRLDERAGDRREALGEVVLVARDEPALALTEIREGAIPVPLHLEGPALASRRLGCERRQHRPVARLHGARRAIAPADEEPVLRLAVEMGGDEGPDAAEPFAGEPHSELPVALLLEELVGAAVPDLDGAGAVLALRNLAGEVGVVERMVLDVDGERAR